MTLEELLKALEAAENGSEMTEVVKGLQAEITKKNNEAKNLRERLKASETDSAALKGRFEKVASHIGLNLEEGIELEEALAKFDEARKGSPSGDPKELVELRSDIQRMKRELEKIQKEKDKAAEIAVQERDRRIKTDRDRKLSEALSSAKAISPNKLVRLLADNVKILDDDSMVFIGEDGEELDLKEGVTAFLKDNPEFVMNDQRAGGGSGGGGDGGRGKTYSKAEIEAMTPEQINANWDKVQASLSNLT